jgi:UrcA family protein
MTYFTKFNDLWHGSMLVALTACMGIGLTDVARSATPDGPPTVKVGYGDLDLTSAQGAQTLHARITAAARRVCASDSVDMRDLPAFTAARSCETQAIANAEREVQATTVASLTARHTQG